MRLLVSAGDASGELHAAAVVDALRTRAAGLDVAALGGSALEKAGARILVPQAELAIGGLVEVLGDLGRVRRAWARMTRALAEERPDVVMLVDSPDFNMPLAKRAKRLGLRVLWFISPQLWAWRRGRVRKIAARADLLAAIFPFELAVYAGTPLRAEFVGHPLVDRLAPLAARTRAECRAALGLDAERSLVALFPGSRRNELRNNLGLHVDAARALHAQDQRVAFALAAAPSLAREEVERALAALRLPQLMELRIVADRAHVLMRAADAVLAKPGTTTLEAALLGTPQVVTARVPELTWQLVRRLVSTRYWAMPNLIAEREVVPELVQHEADSQRVAAALRGLLAGPARDEQLAGLARVRAALGGGGAAQRVAELMLELAARR
ncbi:MAG: lipid-A-disaccharide synthase [Deltaproteobacteria bacterium]|nr:lipid-A-disaccharide synthase [Deltaproteobacteria bacterium]